MQATNCWASVCVWPTLKVNSEVLDIDRSAIAELEPLILAALSVMFAFWSQSRFTRIWKKEVHLMTATFYKVIFFSLSMMLFSVLNTEDPTEPRYKTI